MLKFEWDEDKNQINIKKHGISFEEAASVFEDEESLVLKDESHSNNEERFLLIGFSFKANMLVVCHCYRDNDADIRIISARKATSKERGRYLEKI